MYRLFVKPLLFLMQPEKAHYFATGCLTFLSSIPGISYLIESIYTYRHPQLEKEVFGLRFKNPVGLAAGFDKDARWFNELSHLGFGFVEIGTLTPKGQEGNPKPRLFRIPEDEGLINRMGFNNDGVLAAVQRLKKKKTGVIIGGNIGKNKITPNEQAVADYVTCFEALFDVVDYFVVNVSSPNTPNLRALQDKEPLTSLLNTLQQENKKKKTPKPILLKNSARFNGWSIVRNY